MQIPAAVETEEHLEELLSEPTAGAIETLGRLEGDIIVLGVAARSGDARAAWRGEPPTPRASAGG